MIPQVWMVWCHRKATCNYCPNPIELATPMVICRYYKRAKDNENSRGWSIQKYYHPDCWVENGLDYLKHNPYFAKGNRGRPKIKLGRKDARKRRLLLMRKASLEQRRRNIKVDHPDRFLVEARIDTAMAGLMVEIAKVGGVPKSWLVAMHTI